MTIPELFKGYICPDLEDCHKCEYYKTECIVFSDKGKKKYKEYEKLFNQNKELAE